MNISLENISFSYPNQSVLNSISLTLDFTTKYALMGKSGMGKTTLLHIISGILSPNSGTIVSDSPYRSSTVFQEPRLLPWYTVVQNIQLTCPHCDEKKIISLLSALDMGDTFHKYPHELSGGMAQRVSIARALLYGGDVFLLDEPFSGLDQTTKETTAKVILEYTKDKPLIAVLHHPEEASLLHLQVLTFKSLSHL